jgi:L-ascorbate metabolism protein UlaG (beta-lactamase superfamily)
MERRRKNVLTIGILAAVLAVGACGRPSGPPPTPTMASGKVEVHWLGQAAVKLTSPGGKVIVIDPFITNNPKTPADQKDLAKLGKVDFILVTHGHGDHTGDVSALQKLTGATVAGPAGLVATMIDL